MSGIGGGPLEELQHSIDVNTKSDDCSDDSDLELSTGEDDHNSVSQSFDLHTPFDAVSSYATVDVEEDEEEEYLEADDPAQIMGFKRYIPSPFMIRRTAPWIGRDDDPRVIRKVLEDFQTMTECYDRPSLLGVDQKIGVTHMKIQKGSEKFSDIIREIPVLHLLKARSLNFCSGYKDAGALHLLKFMLNQEGETEDIIKLLSLDKIRKAVRIMYRLALSLCLAVQIMFIRSLSDEDAQSLITDLQTEKVDALTSKWDEALTHFIDKRRQENPTFQLHHDMLQHAVEIVGINLAERIGGPDGYCLLRGCLKSSLLFSFINGSSSYAAYSTYLLADHCAAPPLLQGLKKRYFSVPYEGSGVNCALDTIREEEHRKCKKFFRSGTESSTIERRMSRLEEAIAMRSKYNEEVACSSEAIAVNHDNWKISNTDVLCILPTASLIVRRFDMLKEFDKAYNIYLPEPKELSDAMLDSHSNECGEYLLYKYCASEQLFQLNDDDVKEKADNLQGAKELVTKVLKSSSTTVNRNRCAPVKEISQDEKFEIKRKRKVGQEKKRVESLASTQNTCQAVVDPKCAKYKVMKSLTVPRALVAAVAIAVREDTVAGIEDSLANVRVKDIDQLKKICEESDLIHLKKKKLPQRVKQSVKVVTIENAGSHHKAGKGVCTGNDFIRDFEKNWITCAMRIVPETKKITVSEEKYSFTPDTFKGATRAQRMSSDERSIAHLKVGEEVIGPQTYARSSITKTSHGKKIASTFLAKNAHKLSVTSNVSIVFDSELHTVCLCRDVDQCECHRYTLPIQVNFTEMGYKETIILQDIKQRKGEAECSQVDWVIHEAKLLNRGDSVLSLVSSADIDAVVLHIYAVSQVLSRDEEGRFLVNVFVALKKGELLDVYDITGIVAKVESAFDDREIGAKIAMILCMAGNDFLP